MDIGQKAYYVEKQHEAERIERIRFKLMTADAFYYAYIGGQWDKAGHNRQIYQTWANELFNDLIPQEEKAKQMTFWERNKELKKKTGKRSFKIL